MEQHLKIAHVLAHALDNSFNLFGLHFGFSALIDFIPGVGDFVDAALSFYLVWIGLQLELPSEKIVMMLGNITLNFVIGLIPFFGDLIYFIRKANLRNLTILEEYAQETSGVRRIG